MESYKIAKGSWSVFIFGGFTAVYVILVATSNNTVCMYWLACSSGLISAPVLLPPMWLLRQAESNVALQAVPWAHISIFESGLILIDAAT